MVTLSIFKHRKQYSDFVAEAELLAADCEFLVRVKYEHDEVSLYYHFNDSTKARFYYTQICLFMLS